MLDFTEALEDFKFYRILYNGDLIPVDNEPHFLVGLYARHELLAVNNKI
jgi:hypothetical protein